jgi:CHASE2 domain-containing sensor protein
LSGPHGHPREPFGNHLRRAIPVIGAISLLVQLLHHGIWFSPFETATLDALLLQRPRQEAQHVILVSIEERDYQEQFHGRSPLDRAKLEELLAAIARGRPSVIGVDIDTSDPRFLGLAIPPEPTRIVWAQDAQFDTHRECTCFGPLPVLGGRASQPTTGIALMPRGADGSLRGYKRWFHTPAGWRPSFSWRIASLYRRHLAEEEPEEEERDRELILDFSRYEIPRISAGSLLAMAAIPQWSRQERPPFDGKIVLLGGFYRAARDEYSTPLGVRAGVELTALAIESDLSERRIRPVDQFYLALLEIAASLLLVYLNWRLPLAWALASSLIVIPLAALVASVLAFSTSALWLNAVPLLAAVLMHQLYDYATHYRQMYLKLEFGQRAPRPEEEKG